MDIYLEIYYSYEYRLCIPDEYKNRVRAHEAWIISSAKLSEKHPTNGHPVHLFTVAPSKLIVEHVLNFSYEPPRLFSVARVLFKNSCERPVVSILPWKIERPFRIHERKCSVPKMRVVTLVLLSISLFCTFQHSRGYNILGICPSASYSHQQSFQALMKALADRGHKVTVLSTVPLKVSNIFFHIFFAPFPSLQHVSFI